MGMTIETIIKDCEQSIKQSELFIKAHQANMEIGEIKEYQYYIERDKLTIDIMRKYQKMQADYENRLNADMVAMLTDIQLEIEELDLKDFVPDYQKGADETREYIADLLQQKIDVLKEIEPQKSEDNNADMRKEADETN